MTDKPQETLQIPTDASADALAASLFSEVFISDQLARDLIGKALPKGMQISHFSVLNHLARVQEERTPAQLARSFHVTRGAMTNTLSKLVWAGHVHIRPDWDDARRKFVAISPAGRQARDAAPQFGGEIEAVFPIIQMIIDKRCVNCTIDGHCCCGAARAHGMVPHALEQSDAGVYDAFVVIDHENA